jgi:Fic family protein
MYFFPNIKTTPLAPQLIMQLTKLYENKGRELYYLSLIKNDSKVIKHNVIEADSEYSGHLLNINLSAQKYKLLTQQGVTPTNRKEKLIANFLKFFQIMHKAESNWKLSTNGVIEIQEFIFREFDPNSTIEKKRNRLDKKNELDNLISQFNRLINEKESELVTLFCAFTIDFINLRIFDNYNEFIGIILLMLLLKQYGYKIVDHISFFKAIYTIEAKYTEAVNKSSLNWGIGLPQYHFFTIFIVNILNSMYDEFEKLCQSFQNDKKFSKEELVEQIVFGFNNYFTKDDIRKYNPYISDSTINRSLKNLRERGIIEPTGKGRSAKWRKLRHGKYQTY